MNLLKNFAEMYDDDIETKIFDGLSAIPNAWREYFNVETTDKYTVSTTGYSGFGQMPEWKDGANIPLDQPSKIYDNTITQSFYGYGFKASRKLVKYGEIAKIMRWAKALGRGLAQLYSQEHADVLNDAFSTTYTSLGSVALISASHGSSGSSSRSNINASAALSHANLETLIVQGMNHQNYRGLRDPIVYTKLITVPALRRTALKILRSTQESGTTDNDINVHFNELRPIFDPFLSDSTTHYFLQAEDHGLRSVHGMMPEEDAYMERSSKSRVYTLEADFGVGVEFWEGVAGSQGA